MLLELEEIAPELTPYCRLAYAEASVLIWKIYTAVPSRSSTGRPTGTSAVLPASATDPTELVLCFNPWLSGRYITRRINGCGCRGCETHRTRMWLDGTSTQPRKM